MSVWHWVAGIGVIILLTATKGAVRGGIVILLITFAAARIAYVVATTGQLP